MASPHFFTFDPILDSPYYDIFNPDDTLAFGVDLTGLQELPIYHPLPTSHWTDTLKHARRLPAKAAMADFSFTEDYELQKLNAQVVSSEVSFAHPSSTQVTGKLTALRVRQLGEPEEFEHWEKLVRAAEAQENGLNRNSSPQAIAATRDVYDRFLARFPLFFGYWKKYADLEFSIAGTEAAEMVNKGTYAVRHWDWALT